MRIVRILQPIFQDWNRVKIIVPLLCLLIFLIWISLWGSAKTQEIRDHKADFGGRYAVFENHRS